MIDCFTKNIIIKMVCDKCLNDDCYCNKRIEYGKLYREHHKINTRIVCQCGLSYNTYNSRVHINRHNNSKKTSEIFI